MAPTGAQLYRIFVIVARNDPGKGAADPWNNVVHAWADRYGDPATVDGTRSGDRLTDPFTGQYETLEAGQNKQGYGEVTIYPNPSPNPAPAALTAAAGAPAGAPAKPATPLRFGSGGIRVTSPGTRAAAPAGGGAGALAAAPAPAPAPDHRPPPGGAPAPRRHRHRPGQLVLPRRQQQRHADALRGRPGAGRASWWASSA